MIRFCGKTLSLVFDKATGIDAGAMEYDEAWTKVSATTSPYPGKEFDTWPYPPTLSTLPLCTDWGEMLGSLGDTGQLFTTAVSLKLAKN